jgi:hypothetical protein
MPVPEQPESNPMQDMENFIARMGRMMFEEPAMCTSWVIVSEWHNGVDYWTSTMTDEDTPPWRHIGLLNYAAVNFDEDEGETSEEEDDSTLD